MPSHIGPRDATDVHEALAFAEELADVARSVAQRHLGGPLQAVTTDDARPAAIEDRSVEQMLRKLIGERYPEHAIYENRRDAVPQSATWALDPIERTEGYRPGSELLGTSIALVEGGRPVLGVIDLPILRERWAGTVGATHFNGRPVWTSAQKTLSGARLYKTSRDMVSAEGRAAFCELGRHARVRQFGGDCCAYGLLASGHCDLVVEEGLRPAEFMALVCVVEGAGGIVTDWAGNSINLQSDGRVVAAATRQVQQQVIQILGAATTGRSGV